MNSVEGLEALTGWSVGYSFATVKSKENEVKQGKNYYLSSFLQTFELGQLSNVFTKLNTLVPTNSATRAINIACNVVPFVALPVFMLFATIKHEHYSKIAAYCNDVLPLRLIPESLPSWTVTIINFTCEHAGDVMRVAIVVSGVAVFALGGYFFGATLLTALAYEAADNNGLIPRKISLFMETYMPIVATAGILIGGNTVSKVFNAVVLPFLVFPEISHFVQRKLDLLFDKLGWVENFNLDAAESKVIEKRNLNFAEMNQILNGYEFNFKINPSHMTRATTSFSDLEKNTNFSQFLALFDNTAWLSKYSLMRNKLKDEERFLYLLKEKFPEVSKENLAKNVDYYIEQIAGQENISKEQWMVNHIRSQLVKMVSYFNGEKRVVGSQRDLADAMDNCSYVLAYLNKDNVPRVEKEDILLKLAIEGGDYCARGTKRSSAEVLNGIMNNSLQAKDQDPKMAYERKILQALQDERHRLIHKMYNELLSDADFMKSAKEDVHTYDIYRLYLTLGFYPLTAYERDDFGLFNFFFWKLYSIFRNLMYQEYKWNLIDVVENKIAQEGQIHFGNYIQQTILHSNQLTQEEKDTLIEKFTDCNDGKWTVKETRQKFERLMMVMLGVYTYNGYNRL